MVGCGRQAREKKVSKVYYDLTGSSTWVGKCASHGNLIAGLALLDPWLARLPHT